MFGLLAAHRRLATAAPTSRLYFLKLTVTTALCMGLWLCRPLWIGPRSYPLAPPLGFLPRIDGTAATVLYIALFVAAAAILVAPRPQRFVVLFLGVIALFCLLDQTRWQPWVFLYSFLLAAMARFSWRADDEEGCRRALNIARLIIAFTYIYSGLQKANPNFVQYDFSWIVQPITDAMPATKNVLQIFGLAVPAIQVGFGIGLLVPRWRKTSLVLAVAMHLFILAMLGPLGQDWNVIVWPWTAAMAVFDIVLFAGATEAPVAAILFPRRDPLHAAMLILFAALPLASFFNLWDSYLSAALYSGNLTDAQIYASDAAPPQLPPAIASRFVHTSANTNVLNFERWSIEDLGVPPYAETRVYKAITAILCRDLPDPSQLVLIVREQRLFRSRPETGYRCRDL